tara:strand:+ start:1529 stop:1969 length:441 start_codon:yes stop_codon:yes gene_type:complete
MKTGLEKNMEEILNLPETTPTMANVIQTHHDRMDNITPLQEHIVTDADIDEDYTYARENLKSIINSAQTSIEDLSTIASTSESPRAYEVLSALMKTIVDANKDLLELQRKVKLLKDENSSQPSNVTNALFVGSTTELQKLIKQETK